MSLSSATRTNLLKMIYQAVAWGSVADNAAGSPLTNIAVRLHTADPGPTGDQTTSEASYTGYTGINVPRSAGGWTVTANSVSPAANITFPHATGAHQAISYFSTGKSLSGASEIFHRGVIGSMQGPFTGATNDTITIPSHTLVVDDRVAFFSSFGSTLPTGIIEGTVYWVVTINTGVIEIATTQSGSALDITATGRGVAFKVDPIDTSITSNPILSTSTTLKVE